MSWRLRACRRTGPVQLGPVQLPVGRRLFGWDDDAPRLWATCEPVRNAGRVWRALADLHGDMGLMPILLAFLDEGHEGRPWDEGELNDRCDLASVDRLDAATVIARSWADSLPGPEDFGTELAGTLAPYGLSFPGLAPGQEQALTEAELTRALGWFDRARIGLVAVSRPADVLALVGYNGTVNRYGTPEQMSAALRSWEDRFGAVLVEVGFAHLRMLARGPPRTVADAQAVAAELWAMSESSGRSTSRAQRYGISVRQQSASWTFRSGRCGWTSGQDAIRHSR
jgi:hypothetical protein